MSWAVFLSGLSLSLLCSLLFSLCFAELDEEELEELIDDVGMKKGHAKKFTRGKRPLITPTTTTTSRPLLLAVYVASACGSLIISAENLLDWSFFSER